MDPSPQSGWGVWGGVGRILQFVNECVLSPKKKKKYKSLREVARKGVENS